MKDLTSRFEDEKLVFLPRSDFERMKADSYQEHEAIIKPESVWGLAHSRQSVSRIQDKIILSVKFSVHLSVVGSCNLINLFDLIRSFVRLKAV